MMYYNIRPGNLGGTSRHQYNIIKMMQQRDINTDLNNYSFFGRSGKFCKSRVYISLKSSISKRDTIQPFHFYENTPLVEQFLNAQQDSNNDHCSINPEYPEVLQLLVTFKISIVDN